jgi:hypothetical protein
MAQDHSGIVELPAAYEHCRLNFVYDYNGVTYKEAIKRGTFVLLNTATIPVKGTYISVVMQQDTVLRVQSALCENAGGGYFRVQGLRSRRAGIDGLYHTAPGDMIRIGTIIDAAGNTYETKELRTDMFYIDPIMDGETARAIVEPLLAKDIEYIPPFLFALLNQNLSKTDELAMMKSGGDAMLTFPYSYDVSTGDVLTVLSGTYTQKEVVKRIEGIDDTIGAFFVQEVVSCMGISRNYIPWTFYPYRDQPRKMAL